MIKKVVKFFDKLEDKIRGRLSHYPILYALIGGVGIVLFWRGVWHTADFLTDVIFSFQRTSTIDLGNLPWWDGPLSLVLGSVLLLSTGLFVLGFIGNEIIVSGLKGEKKLNEKEESEIETEETQLKNLQSTLNKVEKRLEHIDQEIDEKK
jgi:hypothetical protein